MAEARDRRDVDTVAQLRHDIDSGRTADKVPGLDPAAAPLGTDDEAAGTPPSPQAIGRAREEERRAAAARDPVASVGRHSPQAARRLTWILALAGLALLLVGLIGIFWR